MSSRYASPLTFELDLESYSKLAGLVASSGAASMSQIIRVALQGYDFSRFEPVGSENRQISVRIDPDLREQIAKTAKAHDASFGEVLRAALGALSEKPLREVVQTTNSTNMPKKPTAKKTVKKAVKKAPVKKAAKKAVKKAPVKKAAAKKTTKKVARKAVKKTAKKATKKTVKKAAKKTTKKAAKKTTKKAAKKVAKKATKKVAKKAAKKVGKKAAKKVTKKAAKKATKKTARKR